MKGLTIGSGNSIGKITCDSPNKLIIGNLCFIQNEVDFKIWHPFNEHSFITVGDRVVIGHACEFVCKSNITIGNDCLIASKTIFNNTGNKFSKKNIISRHTTLTNEIILEDDVWIGTSCFIMQGVTIGEGAVIAAGSLVNKSIPRYEVWAGVPARFIKKRDRFSVVY